MLCVIAATCFVSPSIVDLKQNPTEQPKHRTSTDVHDRNRDSQVCVNQCMHRVLGKEVENGFVYVEVPEQMCGHYKHDVHPYRGWVSVKDLKETNCCCKKSGTAFLADQIVAAAKKHLNVKYVWGGIGSGGYDCSGLVYEAFLEGSGIFLPRDACDQCCALPKKGNGFKAADLVFFCRGDRSTHVLMMTGNGDEVIEAIDTEGIFKTRCISLQEKYQVAIDPDVSTVDLLDGTSLQFRRYTVGCL